jgi:hypothetical protein
LQSVLIKQLGLTQATLEIETFDEDFKDWCVLGDFSNLPAKSKLRITYASKATREHQREAPKAKQELAAV